MDEDYFDPWWREAICAEIGADLFFLALGEPGNDAKRACRMCPVRLQCLVDALTNDIEYGVFGGFGRPERRRLSSKPGPLIQIAAEAIAADQGAPHGPGERDRRRRVPTRGTGHQLRPRPQGRPQERADLAAPGAGAHRL